MSKVDNPQQPIRHDTVVSFHYRMYRVNEGQRGDLIESSEGGDPVVYLHGHGQVIPGLEAALAGKITGEAFQVTIEPERAYGQRKPDSIQRVPVKHLQLSNKKQRLAPGSVVAVHTEHGPRHVVVVKAGKFTVDVDTNHPLAGLTLDYDIRVESTREATAEEIAHRHVHGPGGHHH